MAGAQVYICTQFFLQYTFLHGVHQVKIWAVTSQHAEADR